MSQPSVSIIVPVYNVELYIRKCIESIYRQGLDDGSFEVIIVNDGSKDQSMEAISDIIEQHNNIIVINQENQGLSVARNNGIKMAKGEYVFMPDPDDLLVDNSLAYLVGKAISSKADLVVADHFRMNSLLMDQIAQVSLGREDGMVVEKSGEELFMQDLNPKCCFVWQTLYRKSFLTDNNIYFEPGIYYEDFPFTHECYLKAKKCLRVSWLLYVYRECRPNAITSSYSVRAGKDLVVAIAKTWELTKKNNSPQVQSKIKDDVFSLFYFNLHEIVKLKTRREKYRVIDSFKETVPDLRFRNGKRQKLCSFLYHYMPHTFVRIASFIFGF